MKLLTVALAKKTSGKRASNPGSTGRRAIGTRSPAGREILRPVWCGNWLITECDPEEPGRLFGLCDLGMGYPELGYVSLYELQTVKGKWVCQWNGICTLPPRRRSRNTRTRRGTRAEFKYRR